MFIRGPENRREQNVLMLNRVLNALACCKPAWIGFEQVGLREKAAIRVNKMTFLTKCAATLCMVTGNFMTHAYMWKTLALPGHLD